MGYFNSGLPCEHALLVAICFREKLLFGSRWHKKTEESLMNLEIALRNEKVSKLHE